MECLGRSHLKKLNLSHNEITSVGALHISKGLEINRSLHFLNLSDNMIDDEAANALLNAINNNEGLRSVDLGFNGIS